MNPTVNPAAAEASSRSAAADASTAALTERSIAWHVDDVPWKPLTGRPTNKSGYKTLIDAALARPSFAAGKNVPRRTANDGLRDDEWIKGWRQEEERGLSARSRIRWRLSMLGFAVAGDATILGAVLFLTGIVRF